MVTSKHLVFLSLAGLVGCGGEANHLGNPLTLPIRAVSHGITELGYATRRREVSRWVAQSQAEIQRDARAGDGPALRAALSLADVPPARHAAVAQEIASDPALYADPEAMVVTLMVNGG